MFVRNRTAHKATLVRGHVSDSMSVGTIVVESTYRIDEFGNLHLDSERKAAPTDAPNTANYALWHEVSITASGTVYGPARAPHVVPVTLRIGNEMRRLAVFGDRRWRRSFGGDLLPSDPVPFDAMPLSFDIAYGGQYEIPPGPDPVSGLPHPGMVVGFSKNPEGRGFYRDEDAAEGSLLPNIEWPDKLVRTWNDQPEPAGFSPCPEHVALRLTDDFLLQASKWLPQPGSPSSLTDFAPMAPLVALRTIHHACGPMIFPEIAPGTRIESTGLGRRTLRFHVPENPVKVVTASSDKPNARLGDPLRCILRSIHIDADSRHVLFVHGFTMHYQRNFAPEWLLVLPPENPIEKRS